MFFYNFDAGEDLDDVEAIAHYLGLYVRSKEIHLHFSVLTRGLSWLMALYACIYGMPPNYRYTGTPIPMTGWLPAFGMPSEHIVRKVKEAERDKMPLFMCLDV